ncbi:MAG TPA: hypothetical protein VHG29_11545 [Novosphingobium sp.]|nr:hypothetical protein [Novosphingobium sp.]
MTLRRFAGLGICLAALALPGAAWAQPAVSLDSAVYVERPSETGRSLEPVDRLARGDRVVYIVTWYKFGGQGGFTVTNPLPRSVAYQGSANDDEEVSVDGGKSWGRLGALRIAGRLAAPDDVTHVRWRVAASRAASGSGRIAYSAVVR